MSPRWSHAPDKEVAKIRWEDIQRSAIMGAPAAAE
jgi:hypothetical protein